MSNNDLISVILKCTNFAAIKHKDQRRKDQDKTPYINHPIGVAYILTNEANVYDVDVIQAALLHDTVEDTDTTLLEIKCEFGEEVARIVAEVTDEKDKSKIERKEAQVTSAPSKSNQGKLVKMADKIYNLRDLNRSTPIGWTETRVDEYFVWSKRVINGCRGVNEKLEAILDKLFEQRDV